MNKHVFIIKSAVLRALQFIGLSLRKGPRAQFPYSFFIILFGFGLYLGTHFTQAPQSQSPALEPIALIEPIASVAPVLETPVLEAAAQEPISETAVIEKAEEKGVEAPKPVAPVFPKNKKGEWVLTLKNGQTLGGLLQNAGVNKASAHRAVTSLKPIYDVRKLKAGKEFFVKSKGESDVQLLSMRFSLDQTRDVVVRPVKNTFKAFVEQIPLKRKMRFASRTVGKSLVSALRAEGLSANHANDLAKALRQRLDLQRDVRASDIFEVAFEELAKEDGTPVGADHPLYMHLTHKGGSTKMYAFAPNGGSTDYYTPKAQPMRKSFMTIPIGHVEISSGFGYRIHPKSHRRCFHKGIDYRAPRGTPVMASADGVVVSAGYNGGYGRYVRIRHNGQYETAYAHLNTIYVHKGDRIRQGMKIGAVGATGSATGAHLHYEVLERGRQINPRSVKSFGTNVLEGQDFKRFQNHMRGLDLKFAALRTNKKQG